MSRIGPFLALFAIPLLAQTHPKFEDFPAPGEFKGKPAAPKVERPSDRMFRIRIREAAAKGPNFAGQFTIAQWSCGAGCVETVIVNAANGTVYHLPPGELPCESGNQPVCPLNVACQTREPFEFKRESQLLVIHACARDNKPADIYLRWTGTRFERK